MIHYQGRCCIRNHDPVHTPRVFCWTPTVLLCPLRAQLHIFSYCLRVIVLRHNRTVHCYQAPPRFIIRVTILRRNLVLQILSSCLFAFQMPKMLCIHHAFLLLSSCPVRKTWTSSQYNVKWRAHFRDIPSLAEYRMFWSSTVRSYMKTLCFSMMCYLCCVKASVTSRVEHRMTVVLRKFAVFCKAGV
jgi:hypothetical protein